MARLTGAPFIKVEATRYTEVGYYGRDVESVVRELVENAIGLVRQEERESVREEGRPAGRRAAVGPSWPPPPPAFDAAPGQPPFARTLSTHAGKDAGDAPDRRAERAAGGDRHRAAGRR